MSDRDTVRKLLEERGETFAEQAHITVRDEPSALFRLLTLCMLQAKPISADIAVAALRELNKQGLGTPEKVLSAPRSTFLSAFGRAGYARYDESSTTYLKKLARVLTDEYDGDLRELRGPDVAKKLQKFDGVGPACADMFLREVQGIWPEVAPVFDKKAIEGAKKLGLPESADDLAELVDPEDLPRLAAALVRVALDKTAG
ncbi:hypothetical protein [Corynebacterium doosanense]|uniref:Endonuclease n=1 Tax=Corynebacterium doosanense CAU 212 = DSM 45436 TaxID=558173 RepID=A0A097IEY8_9CORY|nr:hypothetical protein [Corynebacterium doosanense]AIT60712.1 endonuclease [Corynebacterium doosanense CAU 212 = DSM 45436]